MLKLRNAVLTALLAFCLAMPFVSCSFNDGATGDVSGDVKVQSDNNQNGGNGGSTGGNSGGDEDSGDNGNENQSGGDNGGSGNENQSGGNEKPVEGTVYTVKYGDTVIASKMPESALSVFTQTYGLTKDTDYTISGTVITLKESGFEKVKAYKPGAGEGGESGSGEVTEYTVKYQGKVLETISAEKFSVYSSLLTKGTDYTISGNVITLTKSGFEKGKAAGFGAGE